MKTLIASCALHAAVLFALLLPSWKVPPRFAEVRKSPFEVLIAPRGPAGPPPPPLGGEDGGERTRPRKPSPAHPPRGMVPRELVSPVPPTEPDRASPTEGGEGDSPAGVSGGDPNGVPGGVPWAEDRGIPGGPGTGIGSPEAVPRGTTREPVVITPEIAPPILEYRVEPQYPRLALLAGLQGTVVLDCVIERDGSVRGCEVREGHPFFIEEARNAVLQWRYSPAAERQTGSSRAVFLVVRVRFEVGR